MRLRFLRLFVAIAMVASSTGWAQDGVPKSEYRQRRMALAEKLKGGAAVLFAAEQPLVDFMPYRQDSDFYYLTGWNEPGAALLMIGAGPETTNRLGDVVEAHGYQEFLFLPARDAVMEKYTGVKIGPGTAFAASAAGVDVVMAMNSLPGILTDFVAADRRRGRQIWTQTDLPAAEAVLTMLATSLGDSPDAVPPLDVRDLTKGLRTVKSTAELGLLKKASDASIASQLAGMKSIRPGVRERTVAGIEIEKMMEEGCERPSYAPIVGSGLNSTTLHYSANSASMQLGDVVVIDAAGEYSMYASDITRTMPVDGKFTARQREIYEIVLGAQKAAAAAFVAGQFRLGNVSERGPEVKDTLDKVAYDYINTHGKDLHGQPLGKYFLHGLGHSVGIDVHDPMDPQTKLDRGMVFTIEPGVYIPEEKIGVRVEDVFYVDGQGRLVDLIEKLPHAVREVEGAMRSGAKR